MYEFVVPIRLTLIDRMAHVARGAAQPRSSAVQFRPDSLGVAVLVARLEGRLGVDPFKTSEDIQLPLTIGDLVKVYENGARLSDLTTVYCSSPLGQQMQSAAPNHSLSASDLPAASRRPCGRQPCDAHHLRFSQSRAIGSKVSDEFTVPLCRGHHRSASKSHGLMAPSTTLASSNPN